MLYAAISANIASWLKKIIITVIKISHVGPDKDKTETKVFGIFFPPDNNKT